MAEGSSTADPVPGIPSPGAPDELCPGSLDAARVYVAVEIRSGNRNTSLVYPVDAPELACAYEYRGVARHPFVGIDGEMLEVFSDDESVYAHEQAWLHAGQYDTVWTTFAAEPSLVAALGCDIGSNGGFYIRQRHDGELGFFCDNGIGDTWVYDRPEDVTPLAAEVQLVAPLPADRWLVTTVVEQQTTLAVLNGDGQQLPLTLGPGLDGIVPLAARSTAEGALVAGLANGGLELLEIRDGTVTTRAVYEHAAQVDAPVLGLLDEPGYPRPRPALGADGTLAYVDETALGPPRAMWLRPETAPAVAAEVGVASTYEIVEVLDVLSL